MTGAALRWGVATTIAAPLPQVLAFAAWYLHLGAARIWLHFDDPADPAADLLAGHPRLQVIRCDDAFWHKQGGARPPTHQQRQSRNITRVLRRTGLPWVGHFDADEFLQPDAAIGQILAGVAADQLILRAAPAEALHSPGLADDIFTARYFRAALPQGDSDVATKLYDAWGPLLDRGMLSHTVGKCFFRSQIPGMSARIHGARIGGEIVPGGPFHPQLTLLHFHAENREAWLERLPFRLSRGAYQYRPDMRARLLASDADEIALFYDSVQLARPDLLAGLRAQGLLREESLNLRAKVDLHFAQLL